MNQKFDVEEIRKEFPILKEKVHGKELVYFDNAATTQKPVQVIEVIKKYYEKYNSNVHRGLHSLSEKATKEYEKAREKVANFINANSWKEIVFTSGTTQGINIISHSLVEKIGKENNIVLSEMEHHSNLVPWFMLKEKTNCELRFIPVLKNGTLNLSNLEKLIDEKTVLVSIAHVSNVLGTINPVKEIIKVAHKKNALVLVDAAQSVPHMPVNVQKLDIDFLVFSGHKMLGPTGIGVLYGKEKLLEELKPVFGGGDMISEVSFEGFTVNELPWKFEAGTPNIVGGIGLGKAIDYLQEKGMEKILEYEQELTKYTIEKLQGIEGLKIFGPINEERLSVISFNLEKIHAHDVSSLLDREGIAIRSGHHCAQPLMKKLGMLGTARVSLYLYNTKKEIDKLIEALEKVKKVFS